MVARLPRLDDRACIKPVNKTANEETAVLPQPLNEFEKAASKR